MKISVATNTFGQIIAYQILDRQPNSDHSSVVMLATEGQIKHNLDASEEDIAILEHDLERAFAEGFVELSSGKPVLTFRKQESPTLPLPPPRD